MKGSLHSSIIRTLLCSYHVVAYKYETRCAAISLHVMCCHAMAHELHMLRSMETVETHRAWLHTVKHVSTATKR